MESLLYHLIRAWCAPSILTFLTSHYSGAARGEKPSSPASTTLGRQSASREQHPDGLRQPPVGHSHPKASLSTLTLAMPSPGCGVQGQEGELSGTSGFLFCWKAARCRAQCQGRGTLGTSELRAQVSPVLKTISEQLALWSFRDRAGPQHREEFEIQSRAGKQTPLR